MTTIRVGSRDSKLAIAQANIIMAQIRESHPTLNLELVTMKTTGDKILNVTLDKVGGKGLFVKELDEALLDNRVDITVHSCKDLPAENSDILPLLAFFKRESPWDALVLPESIKQLDVQKPIGCASARRRIQLKALYPHMEVKPIRGNLQTRLRKLDNLEYSAIVLAEAGLNRIELQHRISRRFTQNEMLPSAGQGILAVQGRADFDCSILEKVEDVETRYCALAERAFIARLDGGCSAPMGVYAQIFGEIITIEGLYVNQSEELFRGTISGQKQEGESLAIVLADRLKRDGT